MISFLFSIPETFPIILSVTDWYRQEFSFFKKLTFKFAIVDVVLHCCIKIFYSASIIKKAIDIKRSFKDFENLNENKKRNQSLFRMSLVPIFNNALLLCGDIPKVLLPILVHPYLIKHGCTEILTIRKVHVYLPLTNSIFTITTHIQFISYLMLFPRLRKKLSCWNKFNRRL